MGRDIRLVYNSDEEIECVHFSLLVKTEALKEKYKGGLPAYVEKHGAWCNRDLALICWMSLNDLHDAMEDLHNSGLAYEQDWVVFDVLRIAHEHELLSRQTGDPGNDVKLNVDWLSGRIHDGWIKVEYCGS